MIPGPPAARPGPGGPGPGGPRGPGGPGGGPVGPGGPGWGPAGPGGPGSPEGAGRPAAGGRIRDDSLVRARALLIARLAIALYLVELLLNLTRPHVLRGEPTLSIFQRLPGGSGSLGRLLSMPRAVFWAVLAGIVVGAVIQGVVLITRPQGRRAVTATWAILVALLGPFSLISLAAAGAFPLVALLCLPSTAFVLWLLHHGQRFARVPLPMLLAAFGWGALIVFGLGRAYTGLAFGTLNGYLAKGTGTDLSRQLSTQYRLLDIGVVHLAAVDTLITAAGVLLLLLLFRHRVTDALTGLILGAAAGLGYNFVESVLLVKLYGSLSMFTGATSGFEYWIRQSIGLLGGQVTFGALAGAGLGIAARAPTVRARRLVAGGALVAAIGGAVAAETLSAWISHLTSDHVDVGGAADTLVISPFLWLLPQAPFIVVVFMLLVTGWRERAAAARDCVAAEAAEGVAITKAEASYLADPALRFWALVNTWRWYGRATALALYRLQSAQLDLAARRLEPQRADDAASREEGDRLRTKVARLRTPTAPAVTP